MPEQQQGLNSEDRGASVTTVGKFIAQPNIKRIWIAWVLASTGEIQIVLIDEEGNANGTFPLYGKGSNICFDRFFMPWYGAIWAIGIGSTQTLVGGEVEYKT